MENESNGKKKIIETLGKLGMDVFAKVMGAVIGKNNPVAGSLASECISSVLPVLGKEIITKVMGRK